MIDLLKDVLSSFENCEYDISLSYHRQNWRKFTFLNGKKERASRGEDCGVMLAIAKDGKVLRMASPSIDRRSLKNLINQSITYFVRAEEYFLVDSNFRMTTGEISDGGNFNPMPDDTISDVLSVATEVKTNWLDNMRASISETCEERIIVNSLGGVFSDKKYYTDFFQDAMGSRNGLSQNRSNGGAVFQGVVNEDFINTMKERSGSLVEELDRLLSAPVCPKMKADLLLPSDQMYIQIHESIGHPLELDRILGDERNYAGGSFVCKEDFGHLTYGPKIMNVVFAPDEFVQPVGQRFDDTGSKTSSKHLIKDGLLVAGIGGAESQRRLKVDGTASTRSSNWNRPPIDRMGNINLQAGASSLDEMINSIENGILMKTNRSWSIDDQRDKFQFGCEMGQLIKDGELREVVRAPNYEGRTIPFWHSLKMVGDSNTVGDFGTSSCGKGEPNQAVRVGHRSPACLFSDISIFPGE